MLIEVKRTLPSFAKLELLGQQNSGTSDKSELDALLKLAFYLAFKMFTA